MNIILLGPQGSGKGTQAEMMADEYPLTIVEMGSLLREAATKPGERGTLINDLINQKGRLLPDGIVFELLVEHLKQIDWRQGLLFDGYPRSPTQFLLLEDHLVDQSQFLNLAINFEIGDQTAIERLANRLVCKICGRVYNTVTYPPTTPGKCECGGELIQRPDDHPEAIAKRLSLYREVTQPLLALLADKGILVNISAEKDKDAIFADVKQIIAQKGLGPKAL